MDSVTYAIKYILIFLPMEGLCKMMEKWGVVYGIFNYSFHKGKARARKVYDSLENDNS